LLPNGLGAPVYYIVEVPVNARGGILLHPRDYMGIDVKRDSDLRVPQPFARDLGVDSRGEQVRCMGVPEVVKANPGQRLVPRQQQVPLMGDGPRLEGLPIGLGNDKCFIR
jgi:hypothetical protein